MSDSDEASSSMTHGRMTRRSTRGQVSNDKAKRLNALEKLKEARKLGTVHRTNVEDLVPDVYVEVDENEYQMKKSEHRRFVEHDGIHDDYDDDSDEFEENDSDDEHSRKQKKEEDRKAKAKKKGTITHMFQSAWNAKKVQDESTIQLDNDDLLKECLASITNTEEPPLEHASTNTVFNVSESHRNPFKRNTSPVMAPRSVKKSRPVDVNEESGPEIKTNSYTKLSSPVVTIPELPPRITTKREAVIAVSPVAPVSVANDAPMMDDIFCDEMEQNDIFAREPSPSVPTSSTLINCDSQPVDKDTLRFYYLDANEDAIKHPGTIYLFGRIVDANNSSESCCVILKNVQRQIFFLKRDKNSLTGEEVKDQDLANDVTQCLFNNFGVRNIKSKITEKKFVCKEKSLPKEGTVLQVLVDANYGRIPADLEGNTFCHVFNTFSTPLERLVTELEIKGPCWLDIIGAEPAESGVSYCQHEYTVNMSSMKGIKVVTNSANITPPPISILCFNILTVLNEKEKERQIVMISMLYNESCSLERPQLDGGHLKRFCFLAPLKGHTLPFNLDQTLKQRQISTLVKVVADERTLLNAFLATLTNINPDLLIAHDWQTQAKDLISRIEKYKLKNWSQLSRLKRNAELSKIGRSKSFQWEITAGRPCLDLKSAAAELVKSKTYEMDELVEQLIKPQDSKKARINLSLEQISEVFTSAAPKLNLMNLIEWNWMETLFCLMVVDKLDAIPLFLQITQIVGGILSRTLMGGRSERNEYLLLHACRKHKYIPPDKPSALKGDGTNKKAQYSGGLVLEPKKGLYETYIILLDFNSLYPSIIQEYNICFTTVDDAFTITDEANLPPMPDKSQPDGILKCEIRELVNRRKDVKALMKKAPPDSDHYKQYNVRQMGLKLTANSMYGCLGLPQFRFAAKTLAAMITAKGREILTHTKVLVENNGFSVIYGDTDSIMVNTNSIDLAHAKAVGIQLKQIVNKNYNLLELDIDGLYKKLLLLKKKKYAGLAVDLSKEGVETREIKGLDIVRRDWSTLAKEIGEEIVDLILSPIGRDELVSEIRRRLSEVRDGVEKGEFPLEKYEILKSLTRNLEEYQDITNQPHAIVAKRLNDTHKFNFKSGDVIKYIICEDGSNTAATQRAYHLSEIKSNPELSIDIKYYLSQQVYPVVSRLCEPIEELSIIVAEVLGIDSARLRPHYASEAPENNEEDFDIGIEQDFNNCEGLSVECPKCKHVSIIRSAMIDMDGVKKLSLENCSECELSYNDHFGAILKKLIISLRNMVEKNVKSPFICDDMTCNAQILVPPPNCLTADGYVCPQCQNGILRKMHSCKKLFDQQCFYKKIFDLDAYKKNELTREEQNALIIRPGHNEYAKNYKRALAIVERFLQHNDFNKVDLSVVFAPLFRSSRI